MVGEGEGGVVEGSDTKESSSSSSSSLFRKIHHIIYITYICGNLFLMINTQIYVKEK